MVTRRNNCARAIRSAAPEAAIAGIRAAGTPGIASAMAFEEGDQPRGRQLRKDFCGFRNGRRAGEMARHAPPLSAVRPPDRVGERVEGLVDVVRRVRSAGRRGRARRSSFGGKRGRSWAVSVKMMTRSAAASRRERDGAMKESWPMSARRVWPVGS